MESLHFVKKLNVESAIFAINLTEHVKSIYAVSANGSTQSMLSRLSIGARLQSIRQFW